MSYNNKNNNNNICKVNQCWPLSSAFFANATDAPHTGRSEMGQQRDIASVILCHAGHPHSPSYWLVVWNMVFMTFHILEISSSQLTFIFFRGVETTNQPVICWILLVYTLEEKKKQDPRQYPSTNPSCSWSPTFVGLNVAGPGRAWQGGGLRS